MAVVYLGLGSNIGNRADQLKRAVELMNTSGVTIQKISTFIETDPVGGLPQSKYLNAAAMAATTLSPAELLKTLQTIELSMGRVRTVANAPRTIDIDILLYDNLVLQSQDLTIPHPRMHQRAFVLEPLREIAPERVKEFLDTHH